jgi:hypothetical protein
MWQTDTRNDDCVCDWSQKDTGTIPSKKFVGVLFLKQKSIFAAGFYGTSGKQPQQYSDVVTKDLILQNICTDTDSR